LAVRTLLMAVATVAARTAKRLSHGAMMAGGGLLRVDDFRTSAAAFYDGYLDDQAGILEGLTSAEARIYKAVAPAAARIALIGCGSGRDLLPMVAAGHEVVGIEPAAQPLATLRALLAERQQSAHLVHGFVEDVALPGSFDVIILSPHCYSYMPDSSRRRALLARLALHLRPNGRLIINYLHRETNWSQAGRRVAGAIARLCGSDVPWEAHDVVHLVEQGWSGTLLFEHFFLPEELHEEAARAGLERVPGVDVELVPGIAIVGRSTG
jgi:SAM-dependent methyltransferase